MSLPKTLAALAVGLLLAAPAGAAPAPGADFVAETLRCDEFGVRLVYPAEFTKTKKYGGLTTLVGPAQTDESLPAVFLRTYLVASGRNLDSLVKFLEDRYRRIDGYSVARRPVSDDFLILHRNYHYPGSELGVDEMVGFKRRGECLLEIRCVASSLAASLYRDAFERILRETEMLDGAPDAVAADRPAGPAEPGIQPPAAADRTALAAGLAQGSTDVSLTGPGLVKVNLAIHLIEKGDFAKARKALIPLLERDPDNFDLNLLMGKVHIGRLDFAKASEYFAKLVSLKPDSLTWRNFHADVLIHAERYDEAERSIKAARKCQGTDLERATLQQNLGNLEFRRGRHAEALAAYEAGLAIRPADPSLHHNLGILLETTGRRQEALIHYHEAVKADPSFVDARLRLGRALVEDRDYTHAMYQYLYAQKCRPDDLDALKGLYDVYAGLKMADKADAILREIGRREPGFAPKGTRKTP